MRAYIKLYVACFTRTANKNYKHDVKPEKVGQQGINVVGNRRPISPGTAAAAAAVSKGKLTDRRVIWDPVGSSSLVQSIDRESSQEIDLTS